MRILNILLAMWNRTAIRESYNLTAMMQNSVPRERWFDVRLPDGSGFRGSFRSPLAAFLWSVRKI